MKILYIARTFGPVGGMERYVFETAREMVKRGHKITVLCRTAATDAEATSQIGVETIMLRRKPAKRGWKDRENFAAAVSAFFRDHSNARTFDLIHSHENTVEQDVSTEHGPCTQTGLHRAPWKYLDYSALRSLILERAKFRSRSLRALACCSALVQKTVLNAYPKLRNKIHAIIPPAYSYLSSIDARASDGRTLGFIGADWKRKGLPKTLEIFRHLRQRDERWKLLIAGVDADRLTKRLISRFPEGVTLTGRVDPADFFAGIDILVHPALEEPFGMVITEALSLGVPVVISDRCGCTAHVEAEGLKIVSHDTPENDWVGACLEARGKEARLISRRTWADVAADYEHLYEKILSGAQP